MIVLFSLITVLIAAPINDGGSDSSDFHVFTEHLIVLGRIANVMSIQAAAMRKNLTARDVATDYIGISQSDYYNIVDINASEIANTLQELEEIKRLKKNKFTEKDLDSVKDISKLVFAKDLFALRRKNNVDEEKTIKEINKNRSVLYENCLPGIFTMGEGIIDSLVSGADDDGNRASDYVQFEKEFNSFQLCLRNINVLNLNLKKVFNIEPVKQLENDLLDKFVQTYIAWGNSKQVFEPLDIDAKFVEKWGNSIATSRKGIAERLDNAHSSHAKDEFIPVKRFTAGFYRYRRLDEALKNFEDPWFAEKIAKNKNLTPLIEELEPFRNISSKLQNFHKAWVSMEMAKKNATNAKSLETLSEKLKKTEAVFKTSYYRNFNSFFSTTKSSFEKCWATHGSTSTNIPSLYQHVKQEWSLIHAIHEYKENIREIAEDGPEAASNNRLTYAQILIQCLNLTKDWDSEKSRKQTENCFSNKKMKIKSVQKLKIFSTDDHIEHYMNSTVGGYAKNKNTGLFFKEIKIIELLECFENNVMMNLLILKDFASSFYLFPESRSINLTIGYLIPVQKVDEALRDIEKTFEQTALSYKKDNSSLILKLENPVSVAENIGVTAEVFRFLKEIHANRGELRKIKKFSKNVQNILTGHALKEYKEPEEKLKTILKEVDDIYDLARSLRKESLKKNLKIVDKTAKIRGLIGTKRNLRSAYDKAIASHAPKIEVDQLKLLGTLILDYTKYTNQLKGATASIISLQEFFEKLFEKPEVKHGDDHQGEKTDRSLSLTAIIFMTIGSVFIAILLIFLLFGMTEKGRRKLKHWYYCYFAKPEDYEKRWRYSLFRDREDGKNALLDAAREGNKDNVNKNVNKGAYINAYNKFGNTALHLATKRASAEIVELLILKGADRSLMNVSNQTSEQTIPVDYKKTDKAEKYKEVQNVFNKYREKTFRNVMPEMFSSISFHIYVEDRADAKLTNRFIENFKSITSIEPLPQTTHCIVKTDDSGVLVTDSLHLLNWIFTGVIIVKEAWMSACLEDKKLIEKDSNYLVENVKYGGITFDTVTKWSEAMAKGAIPYLYDVYVAIVKEECKNLALLAEMIAFHGGTLLDTFPVKENYAVGSRPYLHCNLGPLFLIHDGKADLTSYINDPDKMYTLFTEESFIQFMLRREIQIDPSENPIPVVKEGSE